MVRKDGLPAGICNELTVDLVLGLFKGLGTGFATVSYTLHNSGLVFSIIALKESIPTHIRYQFFAKLNPWFKMTPYFIVNHNLKPYFLGILKLYQLRLGTYYVFEFYCSLFTASMFRYVSFSDCSSVLCSLA